MPQVANEPSFHESVNLMVDRALAVMDLEAGIATAIKTCAAVLQVQFPVKIPSRPQQSSAAGQGWHTLCALRGSG